MSRPQFKHSKRSNSTRDAAVLVSLPTIATRQTGHVFTRGGTVEGDLLLAVVTRREDQILAALAFIGVFGAGQASEQSATSTTQRPPQPRVPISAVRIEQRQGLTLSARGAAHRRQKHPVRHEP